MKTGKQILNEDIQKLQLIEKKINDGSLWKNPKIESYLQEISNRIQLILQILDKENKTEQQYQQMRNNTLNDKRQQDLENLDLETIYSYNLNYLGLKVSQNQLSQEISDASNNQFYNYSNQSSSQNQQQKQIDIKTYSQQNQPFQTNNNKNFQNPPQSQLSQRQRDNQRGSSTNDKIFIQSNNAQFKQNQQIMDDQLNQGKRTYKDNMEIKQVDNNKNINQNIQYQNKAVKIKYEYKVKKEIYTKMKEDMAQFKMTIVDSPYFQDDGSQDLCSICQEQLFADSNIQDTYIVSLSCSHQYHYVCLQPILNKNFLKCPVCNQIFGQMTGDQPNGKMDVKIIQKSCAGYNCDTIQITYIFPNGQKNGIHYSGTTRQAYLPNNSEGKKVLTLLKKAFDQKLIFTIGTSVSTQQENSVVWNGVHHKTSLDGGPTRYGYPDPTYFDRVIDELKQKGII